MSKTYIRAQRVGTAAVLTIERPFKGNALSLQALAQLCDAIEAAQGDEAVRAVVLTGSGPAFCAGADVKDAPKLWDEPARAATMVDQWRRIGVRTKPLIMAVNGPALGGGFELVLLADIVLASPGACFAMPELGIGSLPGGGGSQRLVHRLGRARAQELLLTGRVLDAQAALQWGLVNKVLPEAGLLDEALKVAAHVASLPAPCVKAVCGLVDLAERVPLEQGLGHETDAFLSNLGSAHFRAALSAFA